MNRIKMIFGLMILAFFACKNQKNHETSESISNISTVERFGTYAELSIKEGGEWKEREYIKGSFKNVQELNVPKEHTDHSWYIRYEGPGWESSKVGYRIYLDWRNAIDIFGKVSDKSILKEVGQDGFDSYHEMQEWGMDILKVGKGLGIGSLGRLVDGEVLHFKEVDSTYASVDNSSTSSSVSIKYNGWKTGNDKINLDSELTIFPNKRYTRHTIKASKAIDGIVTGIVDHGVNYHESSDPDGQWAYIATYGVQTLVPDNLGMAIFYNKNNVKDIVKGKHDHLIDFKPTTAPISYYFLGAWEQEKDGIKTESEFKKYLDELLVTINKNNKL